jgi:hypothetical protein
MGVVTPRVPASTLGLDRDHLSAGVCTTVRMVSRAVTQRYDGKLRPSGG